MVALVAGSPRIAILEADVPMPEIEVQFGRYSDMFVRLLTAGAETASLPIPTFTAWDILNHPNTYPDPTEFDAILITGSRTLFALSRLIVGHSAYDDNLWVHNLCAYVKRIYEEFPSKKIIGICFGHQIVAQALGGKVELNPNGWELAVNQVTIADRSGGIFPLKNSTMVCHLHAFSYD
jgi:GMP synthase-like glutamine amidotransferase